jgi:hypothetical protein
MISCEALLSQSNTPIHLVVAELKRSAQTLKGRAHFLHLTLKEQRKQTEHPSTAQCPKICPDPCP